MDSKDHEIMIQTRKFYEFEKAKQLRMFYIMETIKMSPLIAPFYCISVNMQNLSSFFFQSSKVEITKFDVSDRNISKLRPFRVSYYKGYSDTFYDIYRQGILGIYKGNFYRLCFLLGSNQMKYFTDGFSTSLPALKKIPTFFKDIGFFSLIDIFLHPLLFIESRYSVQHRRKNYQVYANLLDVIRKSRKEIYNGASVSITRNFLFVLGLNFYFIYPSKYMNIFAVGLAHFLSYPLLTIQRNIIFQSNYVDYFPKSQFKGIMDTFGFIKKNLGISFLYRGFFSYSLATILWHLCVPSLAKNKFQQNYMKQTEKAFNEEEEDDDEVFEKIKDKS